MLYIVATPIGNLSEITKRALDVLEEVDYILCEDTRVSIKLLQHYNIDKKLISYHKFNETERLAGIISHLQQGKSIALISDSGMPCVSDPGAILVNKCIQLDIPYTVISGASAFVNAFVLSGYSAPFVFVGFLPVKAKERRLLIGQFKSIKSPLIFYMPPHGVQKTMEFLYEELGERKCFIAREISKKFEEKLHTTLKAGYPNTPRGEFVLVVEGATDEMQHTMPIADHVRQLMEGGLDKNAAIKKVAVLRGLKKSDVYKHTITISK